MEFTQEQVNAKIEELREDWKDSPLMVKWQTVNPSGYEVNLSRVAIDRLMHPGIDREWLLDHWRMLGAYYLNALAPVCANDAECNELDDLPEFFLKPKWVDYDEDDIETPTIVLEWDFLEDHPGMTVSIVWRANREAYDKWTEQEWIDQLAPMRDAILAIRPLP